MTTLDKLKSIAEKSERLSWLVCAADKHAVEDVCSALKVAIAQLEIYEGAIESISSKHKPRHETEEYWLKISHEQCSIVLATDTKIARQAKLDAEKLGENL